jgi:hypothetical protein
MRYLKKFESQNFDILDDVKDILLDFQDVGNEVRVDWVDSRYKSELVVIIRNRKENLLGDTFIRLFTYMRDSGFQCNYIFCQDSGGSDKIWITQGVSDFGMSYDIQSINSWPNLELVFHKSRK